MDATHGMQDSPTLRLSRRKFWMIRWDSTRAALPSFKPAMTFLKHKNSSSGGRRIPQQRSSLKSGINLYACGDCSGATLPGKDLKDDQAQKLNKPIRMEQIHNLMRR
jgi:hypothetical protein